MSSAKLKIKSLFFILPIFFEALFPQSYMGLQITQNLTCIKHVDSTVAKNYNMGPYCAFQRTCAASSKQVLKFDCKKYTIYFRIQDVCIIFSVIVVFLLFFNTFIFQAGLVNILINKFKMPIIVTFIYFGLCVGLHVWAVVSTCIY